MNKVPCGWERVKLGYVLTFNYGRPLPKKERDGGQYMVYGSNGIVGANSTPLIQSPCIIVGRKGSLGEIKLSERPSWPIDTTYFVNEFHGQPLNYWYYFLKHLPLKEMNRSTAIPGLNRKDVYSLEINVPPLKEQKRIANIVELMMERSNKVKELLDAIPASLDQYRQSILAYALAGKLTNEDSRGWNVVKLSDVCTSISDGDHQALPVTKTGIPFITISAINTKSIKLNKATRFVSSKYYKNLKEIRKAVRGDVLFSVTGSIAIPALVDFDDPFVFQRHIAILKPNQEKVLSKYLYYLLDSQSVKFQANEVATGTAQLTIPLRGLRSFQVFLPPISVQENIVRSLEAYFSKLSNMGELINQSAVNVDRLELSILHKAFRGYMVPQNSNDEPASALLERIRIERIEMVKERKIEKTLVKPAKRGKVKKMIIPVIEALKNSATPLTSQELLSQAGYPPDATTNLVETFFLDVRNALHEGKISCSRIDNEDVFRLAG